jgi:hypothetical protein
MDIDFDIPQAGVEARCTEMDSLSYNNTDASGRSDPRENFPFRIIF